MYQQEKERELVVIPQIILVDMEEVVPFPAPEGEYAGEAPDVCAIGVPPVGPDLSKLKFNVSLMVHTHLWSHVGCCTADGHGVEIFLFF